MPRHLRLSGARAEALKQTHALYACTHGQKRKWHEETLALHTCLRRRTGFSLYRQGRQYVRSRNSEVIYDLVGKLGSGTFGEVFECCSSRGTCPLALKVTSKEESWRQETQMFEMVGSHMHIATMRESFECCMSSRFYIVLELLSVDLWQLIDPERKQQAQPGLPIDFVRLVSQQTLDALAYLRTRAIIHGDLKPENIMLSTTGKRIANDLVAVDQCVIKLIDFGNAMLCNSTIQGEEPQTVPYRAPEVFLGLPFDCGIDMWSLGCVLYEIYTGKSLFPHSTPPSEVLSLIPLKVGPIPQHMRGGWYTCLRGCIRRASRAKGTCQALFQAMREHTTTSDERILIDFLKNMLWVDPAQRMCPSDALCQELLKGYSDSKCSSSEFLKHLSLLL